MRFPAKIWVILIITLFFPGLIWSQTDLPREFGSMVPVYAGAKSAGTKYTRDSVTVSFTTHDSFGQVVAYYTEALIDSSWKITSVDTEKGIIASNQMSILSLTQKKDKQGFVINLKYPGGRE